MIDLYPWDTPNGKQVAIARSPRVARHEWQRVDLAPLPQRQRCFAEVLPAHGSQFRHEFNS
ncbi:hypothetical protein [Vogesella indigofera]|uniref:hypothetical protein n=1 Tax=Vogesella indigofera TaxID=45465 RepID=UPI00234E9CEA|nr:hypothetical protein [Vogesella indigofera]MDC7702225.1 hypothetical protein [Vogesella indigofera]